MINILISFFFKDLSAEVKVGNPFILLQQSPSQLLSQLVFERQVHPDRLVFFRLNTSLGCFAVGDFRPQLGLNYLAAKHEYYSLLCPTSQSLNAASVGEQGGA